MLRPGRRRGAIRLSDGREEQSAAPSPRAWLQAQRHLAGPWLTLAIGAAAAGGLLTIFQAWLLATTVDAAIFHGADLRQAQVWLWPLLGVFAGRAVLAWLGDQAAVQGAVRVKVDLRARVFAHIQALGPRWLAGERSGALVEDLIAGIESLSAYFAGFLPAMALTAIIPLAILIVVFPMDWLSGLVLLLTAPLIPLFMLLIGKGAEQINQRHWQELARLGGHFLDTIQGLTTLKLFNASRREAQVIARISDDYRLSAMRVLRVAFLSSAVLELFASMGIALLAVFIGFRLYHLSLPLPDWAALPQLGFLQGFFILLLAPEFYQPLRQLGTHYHGRAQAVSAAERLLAILDTPLPDRGPATAGLAPGGPLAIRFAAVHFAYEPGRPALAGADFTIRAGERVALVGASGAGKTTVVNLLLGFIRPDQGAVLVNGQDLSALDLADWRRRLAWVPQAPRLLRGTILDTIRLGAPDAPLARVREAARLAQAADFIESLPLGYLTPLGERGAGLSGGQIQRLSLARAFLRDAPLAILDEATASLDPESESAVQLGIDALARNRTLLVVAHRLATVERADRILVLEQGRVVESGGHAELLARDGPYRRMVAAYRGAP
ncbi:thiol reductant ABC exporter subunit CydD [uncultured Thiodictyon sp.]|uniref:thiol reductant ABC exporter subunit CydD n=1 Tax=uncultured Thiodictyon sp. TaxID=1846217 RepID=UPI0025DF46F0|nr:thiol reductant ABC exporter subunit CydD [uncultured Thiodictyon sp.]